MFILEYNISMLNINILKLDKSIVKLPLTAGLPYQGSSISFGRKYGSPLGKPPAPQPTPQPAAKKK